MKNTTFQVSSVADFNKQNVSFNGMGVMGTVEAGSTANVDLKINDDHFLTGGQLNVKNGTWGDWCHMQVVDADGSLKGVQVEGAPAGVTYDMVPGYPLLAQFYTGCQIMDGVQRQQTFQSPYPAKIKAGMTLRVAYCSVSTVNLSPLIGVNYDLHKIMVQS